MARDAGHIGPTLLVAAVLALTAAWLQARGSANDEDRSQIIVRAGSIIIENGKGKGTIPPTRWSQDAVLGEWKPEDNGFRGVKTFEVTFDNAYAACGGVGSVSPAPKLPSMTGENVAIDFSYPAKDKKGNDVTAVATIRVQRRRAHWAGLFGKQEPKLVPGAVAFKDTSVSPPPAPQQLTSQGVSGGWVSRIAVPGATCVLPRPDSEQMRTNFNVLIQPKAEPQRP